MSDPWAAPAGSAASSSPARPAGAPSAPSGDPAPGDSSAGWASPGAGWPGAAGATPVPASPRRAGAAPWVVVLVGAVALVTGAVVGAAALAVVSGTWGEDGGAAGPAQSDVHTVPVGTCFTFPWDGSGADLGMSWGGPGDTSVVVVDCAEPHDGEVHARTTLSADSWPGDAQAMKLATRLCEDAVAGYVGVPYLESDVEVEAWWPDESSWADGDTTVTCSVYAGFDQETGSLRDSRR